MNIEAVLFDADGVVQNHIRPVRLLLKELVADDSEADSFVDAVFKAEIPCLTGAEEFEPQLAEVLTRFNSKVSVDRALDVWTMIEPDQEVLAIVSVLRSMGLRAVLATNQHAYRAQYMKEELGYERVFDALFYSCDLGLAKPDPEYFSAIAKQLNLDGNNLLFLDDHPKNVEGAEKAGLNAMLYQLESGSEELHRILRQHGIYVNRDDERLA